MADDAESVFDDEQFARSTVRILIDGDWFAIVPVVGERRESVLLPFSGSLHVISACNPGFKERDEVNDHRHHELGGRLGDLGMEPIPAIGLSPDGTWVEPSWAVRGIDRATACVIGREFGQLAVFEVDIDEGAVSDMLVVGCVDGDVLSRTMVHARRII